MESNVCTGCNRPDLPWAGRGTSLPISGCRFTLYPMTDGFIDIILGALEQTDTSAVWSETDALSTVYRGKLPYVADAVKALFINAYREGVHMALEGQFSKGCPGDIAGDSQLDREGEAPNAKSLEGKHFPVHCKLALYPMGDASYIDEIARVWYMAEDSGLQPKTIHYATRIEGDVQDVFRYLEAVCELMENSEKVHHYVLHFTMNCNSPTVEE
ncbi:MAG: thiamine-binding protein [Oscillospiraceae bacterium]|nr:thiamine-binding protein [Oscillospiraceae bacterium]